MLISNIVLGTQDDWCSTAFCVRSQFGDAVRGNARARSEKWRCDIRDTDQAVSFPWLPVIVFETCFECVLCWQPRTTHCDLYVGLVACCTIFVTTVGWLAFRGIGAVATMKLTALMWHAVDGSMKIDPWSARAPKMVSEFIKNHSKSNPGKRGATKRPTVFLHTVQKAVKACWSFFVCCRRHFCFCCIVDTGA